MDIVFVHGYNVTSTKTYGVLPQRLKNLGHDVKDVYLSKYVTLDNDLTIPDISKAFNAALVDLYGSRLEKTKFACITHSTGGLVVRGWVNTYYAARMRALPLSHLIMLAAPQHGSRLASLGKSRLSRLRSLFGVEPGLRILDGLDIASAYQWKLNHDWMTQDLSNASGFYAFGIAGQWIDKHVWDVVVPATYERGSDGVVRAASANLNFQKFRVDGDGKTTQDAIEDVPFLLTPKTSHSDERGIMMSVPAKGDHPVLAAIVQALAVKNRSAYTALANDFAQKTADLQTRETYYDDSKLDRYSQLAVNVTDQDGNSLDDYAIELVDHEGRGDRFPTGFISHIYQNSAHSNRLIFYLNYDQALGVVGGKVGVKVESTPHSKLVSYDEKVVLGDLAEVKTLLKPNQTTYLDVVIRRKLNTKVFQLTKDFSYQKIDQKPTDDWID